MASGIGMVSCRGKSFDISHMQIFTAKWRLFCVKIGKEELEIDVYKTMMRIF